MIAARNANADSIEASRVVAREPVAVSQNSGTPTPSASATASAPTIQGTNAPMPSTYAPGWCGLHIHQVLWNTCMLFNHKEYVAPHARTNPAAANE